MHFKPLIILLLLLAFFLPAHGQQVISASLPVSMPTEQRIYTISPEDVLEVVVFDVAELSHEFRVSPAGLVMIPLIPEPLKAGGLTPDQFRDALANELRQRGLVSDPRVSVSIKESHLRSVAITGAVKNPQIFPVMSETRLLDVLSQAGGLTENAGNTISITRGRAVGVKEISDLNSAKAEATSVNLKDLLQAGNSALNLPVYPGDWVTVPVAGVVYVVGAVNRPGGFPLNTSHEELSVLQALALAEDVKPTAVRDKGMVVRRGDQYPNGRHEIPVNVGQILSGKQPDIKLQANDILFIPDSTGKRAFRRGAEAAIQIATGIAIWHY